MSLQGSLESFSLPEVLNLLAETSKTGGLHVRRHDGAEGHVWFTEGSISGFEVADSEEPFEAIFELLRITGGEFSFLTDEVAPAGARVPSEDRRHVRPAIEMAEARLAEWKEIVQVVPSLSHVIRLVQEAPTDQVTVDRWQWSMLVTIGGGRSLRDVFTDRNLRQFDGSKAVKSLIDAKLAELTTPEAPEPSEPESVEFGPASAELEYHAEPKSGEVDHTDAGPSGGATSEFEAAGIDEYEPEDGRSALKALLVEVTSQVEEDPEPDAQVDGLVDRGPWTSTELASLEQRGGSAQSSNVVPFRPASDGVASADDTDEVMAVGDETAADGEDETPAEEPINRGLLLKFLSSVRN